jgi:hypothetical protein
VIYSDPTFGYHFLQVAQCQAITEAPPDAQYDERTSLRAVSRPISENACNVGVVKRSEDVALLPEATQHFGTRGLRPEDFEGDGLFEGAVGAARLINRTHAASGEFAQNLPWPDAPAFHTVFGAQGGSVDPGIGGAVSGHQLLYLRE